MIVVVVMVVAEVAVMCVGCVTVCVCGGMWWYVVVCRVLEAHVSVLGLGLIDPLGMGVL